MKKTLEDADADIVYIVQNFLKMKTEKRSQSASNKQTASQVFQDNFTRRNPSRFEHIETEKQAAEMDGDTANTRRKLQKKSQENLQGGREQSGRGQRRRGQDKHREN